MRAPRRKLVASQAITKQRRGRRLSQKYCPLTQRARASTFRKEGTPPAASSAWTATAAAWWRCLGRQAGKPFGLCRNTYLRSSRRVGWKKMNHASTRRKECGCRDRLRFRRSPPRSLCAKAGRRQTSALNDERTSQAGVYVWSRFVPHSRRVFRVAPPLFSQLRASKRVRKRFLAARGTWGSVVYLDARSPRRSLARHNPTDE